MKKFLDKFKNLIGEKKDQVSLKKAFENMQSELSDAEKAYGRDFFPKEKGIPAEVLHYKALGLEPDVSFDEIKSQYQKLKKEHSKLSNKEGSKEDVETIAAIEYAYSYFKKKFVE